jgi:pimeloyl-ACP methyl ester carboxylesterase/DNA-binding CsgD family transcriptional regulator
VEQRLATARLGDGTEIVYATSGSGPLLVYAQGWLTHLELSWAIPAERGFYETLSRGRTLVRYDKPGCGLSARSPRPYSLGLEIETLDAVVSAVGATTFDLFGASLGAAVAARWAADHADRVRRLVLYGGWIDGAQVAAPEVRRHVLGLISQHWGLGSDVLADIFAPDADAAMRAAFIQYQRDTATAETVGAMLSVAYDVDIADAMPRITAPTLVIHREMDRAAPRAQGRALADAIPGATFEALPGRSHLPYVGDVDALVRSIRRFLGLPALRRPSVPTLTARQREVAALIADGMTNRDIAGRLRITERSAESHVERIRDRMGFRARSQIAAWYVASGGPGGS